MIKNIFKSILFGILSVITNALVILFAYLSYWMFTETMRAIGWMAVCYGFCTFIMIIATLFVLFFIGSLLWMINDYLKNLL